MSIAEIATCLQSVNSILASSAEGRLTFDEARVLSEFYRDFSDTNSIIAAAEEREAAETISEYERQCLNHPTEGVL